MERQITVDGQTSTLTVKVDLNTKAATWKISAFITTNQVDPSNPEVIEATVTTLAKMINQAVDEAIEARRQILESREGDPDQQALPFETTPEEDGLGQAAGPGKR